MWSSTTRLSPAPEARSPKPAKYTYSRRSSAIEQ